MALQRWTVGSNGGSAPTTADPPSNWDRGGTGSSEAPGRPVPRAGDSERNQPGAIEGTWLGRCVTSATTDPGARRKVMPQQAETAVRRVNAGPPADEEEILHVHDQNDSPSRRQGRAPERRDEDTPCVSPAGSAATARDVRVPATSTLAWHNSRLYVPMSPSRFSSGARSRHGAHRQYRRRSHVRATSTTWRRRRESKRTHASPSDWHMRHSTEVTQIAAWVAGAAPPEEEESPRGPAAK